MPQCDSGSLHEIFFLVKKNSSEKLYLEIKESLTWPSLKFNTDVADQTTVKQLSQSSDLLSHLNHQVQTVISR